VGRVGCIQFIVGIGARSVAGIGNGRSIHLVCWQIGAIIWADCRPEKELYQPANEHQRLTTFEDRSVDNPNDA